MQCNVKQPLCSSLSASFQELGRRQIRHPKLRDPGETISLARANIVPTTQMGVYWVLFCSYALAPAIDALRIVVLLTRL